QLRLEIGKTRERGFSEDAEEFMEGMVAIAMAIHDDQNRLVSTVSFHAPTMRLDLNAARDHVPRLRAAAEELTRLVQV
ncbi:MAG: IclR family transcriptional regulator C-terminal domain-containing protein, partial [Pseudomonadota bacterium]